jgi:hypothetical protein
MSAYQIIMPPASPGMAEQVANWCWHLLDAVEDRVSRMLRGIWDFFTTTMPEWVIRLLRSIVRVTGKLMRVLALVLIWAAIAFGPGLLLMRGPAILAIAGVGWIGCTLAGSAYGLMYVSRRAKEPRNECVRPGS